MMKSIISFLLICGASTTFADTVTLRFLNCTGKEVVAGWVGFRANVNHSATDSTRQGQIVLPANKLTVTHTLNLLSYDPALSQDKMIDHGFDLTFVQGIAGSVNFSFRDSFLDTTTDPAVGWNVINLTSTPKIYLPNKTVKVSKDSPTPVVNIQIGCQ